MTEHRQPGMGRAIIAVVALYGWLLQAFLAGMAPGPMPLGSSAICAPAIEHAAATGDPATPAGHDTHGCCLAAFAGSPCPTPAATSEEVEWPPRPSAQAVWSAAALILPTGPPVSAFRARGPPSA